MRARGTEGCMGAKCEWIGTTRKRAAEAGCCLSGLELLLPWGRRAGNGPRRSLSALAFCALSSCASAQHIKLMSLDPLCWEDLCTAPFCCLPALFVLLRNTDNETSSSTSTSDQSRHPFEVSPSCLFRSPLATELKHVSVSILFKCSWIVIRSGRGGVKGIPMLLEWLHVAFCCVFNRTIPCSLSSL